MAWVLAVLAGAAVFCVTLAMKAQVLASQDLYLHVAVGRWIVAHRSVPDFGIFSGTMADAPWVAHEWLSSVAMALLYDHLGWGGILAATACLLALAIGALTLNTVGKLGPFGALASAFLAWGLCINHLVARPHVVSLPLMVVWIAAHVAARRREAVPPLYLALLMTLWANLHGAYLFGLVVSAMFAAEAAFEAKTMKQAGQAVWQWCGFLGAAVLAACVTPHGPSGLLFPFRLINSTAALGTVYEWDASSLTNNAPLILWLLLILFVSLFKGLRLPVSRLVMFLILLYMAFAHRRHTELLGVLAPLLAQDALGGQLTRSTAFAAIALRPATRALAVGAALFAALFSTLVLCRDVRRGPDKYTPDAALAAVEAANISGPVLNAQNFGGYLIFRGYSPFIDGRVDMYGNAFMERYAALDQLKDLLERYRIAWTILEPANPRTAVMDALPGWTRFYADSSAVVHVRRIPSAP